ncbi:MAG: LysR family transcriptional regulator [Coprobacillaceae bacterium]
MNIRHLEIFIVVCKEQSFTKAARYLFITQPAVSHAISELEKYTNTVLFERFPKQVLLTPAGQNLLEKANHLLQIYNDLKIEATHLEENSTLRIGSSITIANSLLPSILKTFEKKSKNKYTIEIASATTILQKLQNNELDFGLVEGTIPSSFYHYSFYKHDVIIVCHNAYPIADVVTLDELIKHPLLLREKGSAIREIFDSILVLHDIRISPSWTSTNSSALLEATRHQFGIAILPENIATSALKNKSLKEITIKDIHMKNTCYYVHTSTKLVTPSMKLFQECINELYIK